MTTKSPDDVRRHLGKALGAAAPTVTWSPRALVDLDRQRRKFAFWSRWHPFASKRAKYRAALAVLDGLQEGIRVSRFYEWALEMGERYATRRR